MRYEFVSSDLHHDSCMIQLQRIQWDPTVQRYVLEFEGAWESDQGAFAGIGANEALLRDALGSRF